MNFGKWVGKWVEEVGREVGREVGFSMIFLSNYFFEKTCIYEYVYE